MAFNDGFNNGFGFGQTGRSSGAGPAGTPPLQRPPASPQIPVFDPLQPFEFETPTAQTPPETRPTWSQSGRPIDPRTGKPAIFPGEPGFEPFSSENADKKPKATTPGTSTALAGLEPADVTSPWWTAISSAWQHFGQTAIVPIAQMLAQGPQVSGGQMAQAASEGVADQLMKSKAAWNRGDKTESVGHALAAAVPLIGPAAAEAGEQFKSGVNKAAALPESATWGERFAAGAEDLGAGVGTTTGLLLPFGVHPALKFGQPYAAEALAKRGPAIADFAERTGVKKVMSQMVPKSGANRARFGTSAAEIAPEIARDPILGAWTRHTFNEKVNVAAESAVKDLNAAYDAIPETKLFDLQPVIERLQDKLDSLTLEGKKKVKGGTVTTDSPILDAEGKPIQTSKKVRGKTVATEVEPEGRGAQIASLRTALNEVWALGDRANIQNLRKLAQSWSQGAKAIYLPDIAADVLKQRASGLGFADAERTLRQYIVEQAPELKSLNERYSLYKTASDVMNAAEQAERLGGGTVRKAASVAGGGLLGNAIAGPYGGAVGGMVGAILDSASANGVTSQIATGRALVRFADALREFSKQAPTKAPTGGAAAAGAAGGGPSGPGGGGGSVPRGAGAAAAQANLVKQAGVPTAISKAGQTALKQGQLKGLAKMQAALIDAAKAAGTELDPSEMSMLEDWAKTIKAGMNSSDAGVISLKGGANIPLAERLETAFDSARNNSADTAHSNGLRGDAKENAVITGVVNNAGMYAEQAGVDVGVFQRFLAKKYGFPSFKALLDNVAAEGTGSDAFAPERQGPAPPPIGGGQPKVPGNNPAPPGMGAGQAARLGYDPPKASPPVAPGVGGSESTFLDKKGVIGPHEGWTQGQLVEGVLTGTKSAAVLDTRAPGFKEALAKAKEAGLEVHDAGYHAEEPIVGPKPAVDALVDAFAKGDDAAAGKLLGYSEADIAEYAKPLGERNQATGAAATSTEVDWSKYAEINQENLGPHFDKSHGELVGMVAEGKKPAALLDMMGGGGKTPESLAAAKADAAKRGLYVMEREPGAPIVAKDRATAQALHDAFMRGNDVEAGKLLGYTDAQIGDFTKYAGLEAQRQGLPYEPTGKAKPVTAPPMVVKITNSSGVDSYMDRTGMLSPNPDHAVRFNSAEEATAAANDLNKRGGWGKFHDPEFHKKFGTTGNKVGAEVAPAPAASGNLPGSDPIRDVLIRAKRAGDASGITADQVRKLVRPSAKPVGSGKPIRAATGKEPVITSGDALADAIIQWKLSRGEDVTDNLKHQAGRANAAAFEPHVEFADSKYSDGEFSSLPLYRSVGLTAEQLKGKTPREMAQLIIDAQMKNDTMLNKGKAAFAPPKIVNITTDKSGRVTVLTTTKELRTGDTITEHIRFHPDELVKPLPGDYMPEVGAAYTGYQKPPAKTIPLKPVGSGKPIKAAKTGDDYAIKVGGQGKQDLVPLSSESAATIVKLTGMGDTAHPMAMFGDRRVIIKIDKVPGLNIFHRDPATGKVDVRELTKTEQAQYNKLLSKKGN